MANRCMCETHIVPEFITGVLRQLGRRCRGHHPHPHLSGSRAMAATIYPPGLCRAILHGTEARTRAHGRPLPAHMERELSKGCAIYPLGEQGVEEPLVVPDLAHDVGGEEEVVSQYHGAPALGVAAAASMLLLVPGTPSPEKFSPRDW